MKLNSSERNLWFTSDFHAGHDREFIWKKRGFASSVEHVDALVRMVNSTAARNDIVIHLGDLSLNWKEPELTAFMARINCRNFFSLWGNHYSPSRNLMLRETAGLPKPALPYTIPAVEVLPWRLQCIPNLVLLGEATSAVIDGVLVYMSHYPHAVWNGKHRGSYHLCGHSHGAFPPSHPESGYERILDVGVDCRFALWNWREIHEKLRGRNATGTDSLHQQN